MIAVADTSPICYLILIGEIDLLPKLYTEVLVPPAVVEELANGRALGFDLLTRPPIRGSALFALRASRSCPR